MDGHAQGVLDRQAGTFFFRSQVLTH
jgi:hypothetical protein